MQDLFDNFYYFMQFLHEMTTHLSHALLALISIKRTSATALGNHVGLHQATISRACSGERLSVESLRALCSKQSDKHDGMILLLAHLRDEIDRAGRSQLEVIIEANDLPADDDIALLEAQSRDDIELKAIIHDLAQLVRSIQRKSNNYPEINQDDLKVAED